ncbi:PAS domain-containing protein [Salinimicrobium sp. CAU 1759]
MTEFCWKEIFEAMPFACLVLKIEPQSRFNIIDVNQAFLNLTGASRENYIRKDISDFLPDNPNQDHEVIISLKKTLKTGKKQVVQNLKFDLKNSETGNLEERYFSFQNIPIKNDSGKIEVILHTTKEVTFENLLAQREKEIEQELTINRQQFNHFIRDNPDALFRLDLNGIFLHANSGLAKLAELPLDQLIHTSFFPFCSPEDKERILENFEKAVSGKITSFEATYISALGTRVILKVLLMPMILDGRVVEIHGIAKDFSELRNNEKIVIEKSKFLEVNASFVSSLLENEINEDILHETFGIIAQTVEADRMYYFGADENPETGEILISQKVEWCSSNAQPQIDNIELQNMPISKVKEITPPLIKNLPFTATIQELSPGMLKEIFEEQDIKSMLLLPIFVDEKLYGFVGFDDCTKVRKWKQEEITFLKSLTQNLTNAFEKKTALEKVRKSEEDLKRSEQKFRALVQEGSDLIGILDIDGFYSFVSENYRKILGYSTNDLIGENAFHFIHPEDVNRVKQEFLLLKKQKQIILSPFRFRNNADEYRWIQTTATNLLDDFAVQGIIANSRDITTEIEQAQQIEEINERYKLAATATEDLIYDWDLTTNEVTRFHQSRKELFGYPADAVNERKFWKRNMHPEDLDHEMQKLKNALSNPNENYIRAEYRFRRADGSYAQVVDKGYILRDQSGKAIRLIGATSDVTELLAKKQALKVANKRFKMAMKATNEMIWDWDIETDSVTRSKGYKRIFGYDTNEATSVHSFWLNKVAEEDREKVKSSLKTAVGDPKVKKWRHEYRFVKADGKIAYIQDRGYILRNKKGKATRVVGAVLDVTNSRRLLRKIQRQNKLLKEIAWEQSHVVRAPLARIQGLLNLLEQDHQEEMSREEVLYHLKNSANELDDIIRSIVGKTEELNVEIQ